MRKLLFLSFPFLVAAAFSIPVAHGQASKFRRSENGIPNRYIVKLRDSVIDAAATEPTIRSEAGYLRSQFGGEVREVFSHALKGFVMQMSERAAIALSRNSRVELVEQDTVTTASSFVQAGATWGLDRIDQRTMPLNTEFGFGTQASNVNVYVVDSGIRETHVEFGGRASRAFDSVDDGQNGYDCTGHGTHVAGTIGAATWGVAKSARIYGVRVLPCTNSGQVSDLIQGMDWITANHVKPAVANISISASGGSSMMDTAIQNAINAGVTVVVAAGNSNMDACNYSPARGANVIAVGATGSDDRKASYSNFGSCVDIWAPGTSITSVSNANDFDARVMSGTSMASPHVTGVAALYLAANPSASPAMVLQNIVNSASAGLILGLDSLSPNKMVYSWLGSSPPSAQPASVTIRKRTRRVTESISNASFAFNATNLATPSFTLQSENVFTDTNVMAIGSSNTITVTEGQALGWQLSSITCTESSGTVNSIVDLTNRRVNIVAEEGEQIECTFTSDEIAPTSAGAAISGRVVGPDGRGVRGVTITLLDASTGTQQTSVTNSSGDYTFADRPVSHFYIVTAVSTKRYTITDNVRQFTLMSDYKAASFVTTRR